MTHMTTIEAARALGVSRRRISQFILSGRLPAMRPGRDYLIHRRDVAEFARQIRPTGRPPVVKNNDENLQ